MLIIGAYFAMKSVKTVNGDAEKSFCGTGKLESDYAKSGNMRNTRCLTYISVSFGRAGYIVKETSFLAHLDEEGGVVAREEHIVYKIEHL